MTMSGELTAEDLVLVRGQDAVLTVTMFPTQDITGWSLLLTFKEDEDDAAALFTRATGGSGIVITNAGGGVFEVTIDETYTEDLTPGDYVYDIWRTDEGSEGLLATGAVQLLRTPRK